MFTTMRRKRRSAIMKQELGQSVDHFKRAATLAAQETSATVGPKISAARDRVQPIAGKAAGKAKDTASSGWDTAVATLTPLVAAATDNVRAVSDNVRAASDNARRASKKTAKNSKRAVKANSKKARKQADKLQKRADQALGRNQGGRKAGKLIGLALIGAAVGAGAAYVLRKRRASQWDEYEPSRPINAAEPVIGADDAAFEPTDAPLTTDSTTEPAATTIEPASSTKKD